MSRGEQRSAEVEFNTRVACGSYKAHKEVKYLFPQLGFSLSVGLMCGCSVVYGNMELEVLSFTLIMLNVLVANVCSSGELLEMSETQYLTVGSTGSDQLWRVLK